MTPAQRKRYDALRGKRYQRLKRLGINQSRRQAQPITHPSNYNVVQASALVDSPCWCWNRGRTGRGYAQLGTPINGTTRAHRAVWIEIHGRVPNGHVIGHTCGVASCIRPEHLVARTASQTAAFIIANGRRLKGAKHPTITNPSHRLMKLSPQQVEYIRSVRHLPAVLVAFKLGVSQALVSLIRSGKRRTNLADTHGKPQAASA